MLHLTYNQSLKYLLDFLDSSIDTDVMLMQSAGFFQSHLHY